MISDSPAAKARSAFVLEVGARPSAHGVKFRVWAPNAKTMSVSIPALGIKAPLAPEPHGYFAAEVAEARAGMNYRFIFDDGRELPDPVSRFQPEGVHGPSQVVDPNAFAWSDTNWAGVTFENYVIYELHIGTFTPEGTFDAAIAKLPYLKDLGVTAIEIMPVNQCPGSRNWGYDGAYLFAPQNNYGGPDGLKRLVNACHQTGLACVMDVVYNHMGPEGNYLSEYGPYFTDRYQTPWGTALNYDGAMSDPVRRFFLDNALFWFTEYHMDALRLDAIQGIFDFSALHLLAEMKQLAGVQELHQRRPLYLIAESDLNDVRILNPPEQGGHGLHGQWTDDFHHALVTALGMPRQGYFEDFGQLAQLEKAIQHGFAYDGRFSVHRKRRHGNSAAGRPGRQFVVYTQNHDQVANGALGARMSTRLGRSKEKLAAALLLTVPNVPMLFMGQEYGETNPFSYFIDHGDAALRKAVTHGRKVEFEHFTSERDFEDPAREDTFARSKLDWGKLTQPPHAQILALFKDLLALRGSHPAFRSDDRRMLEVSSDESKPWLCVERKHHGGFAATVANFSDQPVRVTLKSGPARVLLATDEPRYGGGGANRDVRGGLQSEIEVGPWSAVIVASSA